ncbi:ABC transporter permease [Saccharicrinis sp. FJH54]|uniref:ABC transporter permease n=1 Tax=Saccharicrinis sp. FJH54 TaxID=3344665 RepID=UPI0035D447E3
MKQFKAVFITEWLKLRHANLFWITICFFIFIPCMMGFMMYLSQHPEIIAKMGIVGAKAKFFEDNSWQGYFDILNQSVAAIGLIGFGFVISWVFGREFTEKTITDVMVMPVNRALVVMSKFLVAMLWNLLLIIVFFAASILIGQWMNLPGWSAQLFNSALLKFTFTALLTLMVTTPVAFIAAAGRGIVLPIAFVILVLILSQFLAMAGFGPYFPWAIPGVFTVSDPEQGLALVNTSYVILFLTFVLGITGTVLWWRYADQK